MNVAVEIDVFKLILLLNFYLTLLWFLPEDQWNM